ncbi:MAG: TolC family protein [Spirochaetes bacterium]|nr:TolC family protein [Spirochaetota bacterium]
MKLEPCFGIYWTLFFLILVGTVPGTESIQGEEHLQNLPNHIGIDLHSAIRKARKQNLELALLFSLHQIEEEKHRLAYRRFLPRITLGYSRTDTVIYHHPDTYNQRLSLSLEQDIYDRGNRASDIRIEEKTLRLRRRMLTLQEEELSLQVVEAYLKAIGLRLQKDILLRALETTREHGRIAHTELSLNEITEMDYLSILLKGKDLELELSALRWQEEQILFDFRALLGYTDRQVVPTGRIDTSYNGFLPMDVEEEYVRMALQSSTQLEEISIQRETLSHKLKQAHACYLPALSLQVALSMEGKEFPLHQPSLSFALKLSWDTPVLPFSMGIQVGKQGYYERSRGLNGEAQVGENLEELYSVPLSHLNLRQSEAEYARRVEQIQFTLKQAFSLLREKSETLKLLREKSALLKKKVEVQRLKVTLSELTRLQFLEAEIELFRNTSDIFKAITELYLQETLILKLCGQIAFGRYPIPLLAEDTSTEGAVQ